MVNLMRYRPVADSFADPARLQAQHDHREKAIGDTYALILRPRIDALTSSLVGEVPS